MRYTVPQFIEHEAKIIGPFTFKQFLYVAATAGICFILYFSLPFTIFLIISIVLATASLAFAFFKIGGRPLSTVLFNLLMFGLSPKMYIWRKKDLPVIEFKKEIIKKEDEKTDELPLKIAGQSKLKKMQTKVETEIK